MQAICLTDAFIATTAATPAMKEVASGNRGPLRLVSYLPICAMGLCKLSHVTGSTYELYTATADAAAAHNSFSMLHPCCTVSDLPSHDIAKPGSPPATVSFDPGS